MKPQLEAEARLYRTVGEAYLRFAEDLLSTSDEPATVEVLDIPQARGRRQAEILALPGLAGEAGMKTSEIAEAIKYEVPNTYQTLQGLSSYVEQIPGSNPQRWRLRAPYRANAETFKAIAALVRPGEWTTYGDISIAVRGDTKAARGVGRAAAALSDFPNPHRILKGQGEIHPEWKDADGNGPEKCRKLLEGEGVRFLNDGRADPVQHVAWFTLHERQA